LESAYSGLPISDIIELFSLGVMVEALRANIDWKSAFLLERVSLTKHFREKWSPPTIHSSCQ